MGLAAESCGRIWLPCLSKLNQNKSPGHSGIGNLIVKKVASTVSKPLTDIFNLS